MPAIASPPLSSRARRKPWGNPGPTIYRPNPNSLAAHVIGYLTLYPKRRLNIDEICDKFIKSNDNRNIHAQLLGAIENGLLDWDESEKVYTRGAKPSPSVLSAWGSPTFDVFTTDVLVA